MAPDEQVQALDCLTFIGQACMLWFKVVIRHSTRRSGARHLISELVCSRHMHYDIRYGPRIRNGGDTAPDQRVPPLDCLISIIV